jgi:hypothetical protein
MSLLSEMNLTPIEAAFLSIVGIVMAFGLSVFQSFMGSKIGSDHPGHVFLTRAIKSNNYRLFVQIPKLLNTAFCAALPLYIHWLLSHFNSRTMFWAERLLNPILNTIHVGVFAVIALLWSSLIGLPVAFVGIVTCLFALTPQFYHSLSARNFGLSARGAGLLLLSLFFLASYGIEAGYSPVLCWLLLTVLGWLIWSFSTFAQQALCIVSVLLLIGGRFIPLVGAMLGLMLFIALHPTYARGYLKHTFRFIYVYATELAPIYILNRRKSIWRDLVWDVWVRSAGGLKSGLRYAYENSVLVVVVLNPLIVVACWFTLSRTEPATGIVDFAGAVSVAGALAALLTSFRQTRFLGEPERYVEVVTPWSVLVGAYAIQDQFGMSALIIPVALFLVLDFFQMLGSYILLNYITGKPIKLSDLETIITEHLGAGARVCSNNEQMTKMLMQNDWRFAYCIAVGPDYCGMKVSEAFSAFPNLRREACERIVSTYRINACVLDRSLYSSIFDIPPPGLQDMRVAYESDGLRLLLLQWEDVAQQHTLMSTKDSLE